nr:MAG TPA: hypothetical protein [Caudoviricetes sp.]
MITSLRVTRIKKIMIDSIIYHLLASLFRLHFRGR